MEHLIHYPEAAAGYKVKWPVKAQLRRQLTDNALWGWNTAL